jgi:hypothetical protein
VSKEPKELLDCKVCKALLVFRARKVIKVLKGIKVL